ncbi:MAG TPA: AraC family transcriptional regulator [Kribbella sp.]|nr:AraC family transcriptional regulator [Kribbella sp.]
MDVLSEAVRLMRTGRPHFSYVRLPGRFGRAFAASDAVGFHEVVRGTCWLFPQGDDPIVLGPGDLAFFPHGAAHGIADGPTTTRRTSPPLVALQQEPIEVAGTTMICGAYAVDRTRIHPAVSALPDVIHLPAEFTGPWLRSILDLLHTELQPTHVVPRPGSDAVIPALLDLMLLGVLRRYLDTENTGWAAALHDPPIARALQAIHDHPEAPWTVATLAAEAGLSRSAFSRRFSAGTGQPPLTYLTWWRMARATELLRTTAAPLATIAHQVGYTSEYAFANAFKRTQRTTPGSLRPHS